MKTRKQKLIVAAAMGLLLAGAARAGSLSPSNARVASRYSAPPAADSGSMGFRCVKGL
jgi:hypothetical protein